MHACVCVCVRACAASHSLPSKKRIAVANLQTWLKRWAHWEGDKYTSGTQRGYAELRTYEVVWNTDWEALEMLRHQILQEADCACVSTW